MIRLIRLDLQWRGRLHSFMWMDGWVGWGWMDGYHKSPSVLREQCLLSPRLQDQTQQDQTILFHSLPFNIDLVVPPASSFADSAQTEYCPTFPCACVCHRRDISSFLDNLIV